MLISPANVLTIALMTTAVKTLMIIANKTSSDCCVSKSSSYPSLAFVLSMMCYAFNIFFYRQFSSLHLGHG